MKLLENKRDNEQEISAMDWKDFVALCIAMYQLFLPRLLTIIAGAVIVAYLLLWFFSR